MDKSLYRSKAQRLALLKKYCRAFFCSVGCLKNWEYGETSESVRMIFVRTDLPKKCVSCSCDLDENDSPGYGHNVQGEHKTYTNGLKDFFRAGIHRIGYEGWTRLYDDNRTGIFPHYKKGNNNNMANSSILDKARTVVRNDAAEGQKRLIARQTTRLIRDSAVVLASRSDAEMAAKAAAFLNTDVGEALVALVTSALASQLPERYRTPEIDEIIREIRIGTITDKMDEAAEMFMAPLRQAGLQLLLAKNKAAELSAGESEPAKLEEPKTVEPVNTKADEKPPVKVTTRPARKTAAKHPAIKVDVKVANKN